MKNKKNTWTAVLSIFVLIILVVCGWYVFIRAHPSPIPKPIKSQLKFIPFTTKKDASSTLPQAVKYNPQQQLLTYQTYVNSTRVVISEQPTPESFTDVPQVYDALITKLRGQDSFDTINGKVDITFPVELKGGQSAVMNSKGVLLFAHPDKQLTLDQWKQFFNSLEINK
jgi:hypothetical protein